MPRFLAIYNGAASETDKQELSEGDRAAFMTAWGQWAQFHSAALLDPGAPLFRKKRIRESGVEDFEDDKTGYAIVTADSHDDAVEIFSSHPHLGLNRGNSIDVLECPPVPS